MIRLAAPRITPTPLPGICQVCGRWPAQPVCPACMDRFAPQQNRCAICACSLPSGLAVCGECLTERHPSAIRHCVAAVDYGFPWDDLIARFKFRDEPGWAQTLARPMREAAQRSGLFTPDVMLVPIPVTPKRLAQRGYNQAWELAKVLSRLTGLPARADLLVRLAGASDQHTLPEAQRLRNLVGAFAANPLHASALPGRKLVLVDDVRTTGATLNSAAAALLQAGAAEVNGLVLARTALGSDP